MAIAWTRRAAGIGAALALCAALSTPPATGAAVRPGAWAGSWASSQMLAEGGNALPAEDLGDATLRQIVHLSVGGAQLRVRLSNAFGTAPLRIAGAHVARAVSSGSAAIVAGSDRALSFSGAREVTIPAGAEYWSDPVALAVPALADLAVSLRVDAAPARQTSHPGSRATSYLVRGDRLADADLPDARKVEHWYFLSGVDVAGGGSAVVALGDSITDGHGATTNGNDRWPDLVARRLQAAPASTRIGMLNQGIGGNRVLLDGLGPNAMARFERDVLAQTGVRTLIVLEGVNDLGTLTRDAPASPEAHEALVQRIISAYAQMVAKARAHGVRVIGATILPYTGSGYYHPDAQNERDRVRINEWIRAPGQFDGVVDFDRATRDPAHPERLRPDYDSGDHLHPSPAGYRAMAAAVPLALLSR